MLWDGVTAPFVDLYYGLVCDDSSRLGRGVGVVGLEAVGGAAALQRYAPRVGSWWHAYNAEAQQLRIVPTDFSLPPDLRKPRVPTEKLGYWVGKTFYPSSPTL